ncbi:MAG: hypothetical protein Q8P18_20825 [Pseudomonadota bacterium]|nr:hypothetical protein [Pseudomonadota bacterium]
MHVSDATHPAVPGGTDAIERTLGDAGCGELVPKMHEALANWTKAMYGRTAGMGGGILSAAGALGKAHSGPRMRPSRAWAAETTTRAQRKTLLRTLVREITPAARIPETTSRPTTPA